MRSNRLSANHQEAVSRRLALLSAELSAVRESDGVTDDLRDPATSIPARERDARHPPEIPVPGRHARRRGRAWLVSVPDTLRGRVALGPGQVAVVAVVVALGLAVTGWWLVRGSPEVPVASTGEQLAVGSAAPLVADLPSEATSGRPSAKPELVVDVAGKVRRPGIAVLAPGSRVVDALAAAGGARPGTDLSSLNLARQLVDGEQVLVGRSPVPGVAASALANAPTPQAGGGPLVSINTAGSVELETLPQVGPVTAQAIIDWRDQHGSFTAVDELLEVDGIGEVTLSELAPLVTL